MTTVTVYWRKRCPYCIRLRRQLRRVGLPTDERDIWADPAAAATVREITGGDETVPTVVVGSRRMVNPDLDQVLAAVRAEAPELWPLAAARRTTAARWWVAGAVAGGVACTAVIAAVIVTRSPATRRARR